MRKILLAAVGFAAIAGAAGLAMAQGRPDGPPPGGPAGFLFQADANHDNVLTRAEFDAGREPKVVFDNWHLSAYALVALVAWRRRILLAPRLAPMTMTMAAAAGLVIVVYFFTSAAGGVADETLVNRFLLHLAPALAFYALLLYVEGRDRPGDQPSLQATNAVDA